MLRNKVMFGALVAFLGVAAFAQPPAEQKSDGVDDAIVFCGQALKAMKSGPSGRQAVAQAFSRMNKDAAGGVLIICRSYEAGYSAGQRDFLAKMS